MRGNLLRNLVVMMAVVVTLSACRRDKILAGDHPIEFVGEWQLLIRSSCRDYGLTADKLVLKADGTFDQRVTMTNGKQLDVVDQHWQYDTADNVGHIALDKRLELFTPEHFAKEGGRAGVFEVLVVEYKSEPVIILNPDSDCVYVKSK